MGMLLIGAVCSPFFSASGSTAVVTVNTNTTYQKVGGIGGNMVYYLDWATNHPNKEALYDTLFTGLGLSALRIGNWAQKDDADFTIEAEIFHKAKELCGQDLPVVMCSWSAPAYLKANGKEEGGRTDEESTLKKEYGRFVYEKFGQWWRRSLERYREVGIYPEYISIQNEPDCKADYSTMILTPTEQKNVAGYGKALDAVANEINKLDNPPKIIGADNIGIGWNQTQNYIKALNKNLLSGYGFHYYHSGYPYNDGDGRYYHPEDFKESMAQMAKDLNDKPLWMTENSQLRDRVPNDAIYTAHFIANAFNVNRVQYYLHWNTLWNEGTGCINVNKWDEEQTFPNGISIEPEYHGLRHFSKYARPGYLVTESKCNSGDIVVCVFQHPQRKTMIVNLINISDTKNHSLDLKGVDEYLYAGYKTRMTVTCPGMNLWSRNVGAYDGNEIWMPANTILTLEFTDRKPTTLIYNMLSEDNREWNSNKNWTPSYYPMNSDTTVIRNGEVFARGIAQSAPVVVEKEGIFRVYSENVSVVDLHLYGGVLKSTTGNPYYSLSGENIFVHESSTIQVGSKEESVFALSAPISGNKDLTKTSIGVLDLLGNNAEFSGWWQVREGTLRVDNNAGLGVNGAIVYAGAKLDVIAKNVTDAVVLEEGALLNLQTELQVNRATIAGKELVSGRYTAKDFPEVISGDGVLIVVGGIPTIEKQGNGGSKQTLERGNDLVPFSYTWTNAQTVEVKWIPRMPEGLDVEINDDLQTVFFSGAPTEIGSFDYIVSSVSYQDSVVTKTGKFVVLKPTDVSLTSAGVKAAAWKINPVESGSDAVLVVSCENNTSFALKVTSAAGALILKKNVDLPAGEHEIVIPTAHLAAGVYFVNGLRLIVK